MPRLYVGKMATPIRLAVKRVTLTIVIAVAILFSIPLAILLIARVISLSMILVQILAPLLGLFALAWFVYRVWGKAYFRVWNINRIRNARYLREAVERGKNSI